MSTVDRLGYQLDRLKVLSSPEFQERVRADLLNRGLLQPYAFFQGSQFTSDSYACRIGLAYEMIHHLGLVTLNRRLLRRHCSFGS